MENESKGLSVAALIFGILGMLCCCVGFPFAIVGLILAIIALAKRKGGKGLAIGSLITSLITLIISAVMFVIMLPVMPYMNGFIDLGTNPQQYVDEYNETGEFPPVIEDMISDGLIGEDQANDMMDQLINNFKAQGVITSD